ncbi:MULTISPECIES: MmgE/PrpD family protein [unclassified Streptomyces]|uniref:MmgE/PrpD family protein n=1 Tax=unclassified Streptomyces TaxID=2593676 RepID=UPI002E17A150|nr:MULTISPECIES: MmgE/PrpD family protein [unclassified Streptomyces]
MDAPLDRLAHLVTHHSRSPLPAEVRDAARRTLYNALATTVGAAREPATDIVVAAATGFGDGQAVLPGRPEQLRPLDAALATGLAAHLDDYDDTHLRTVIHPGAVCLGALVGLQDEIADRDADEILGAFAWGVEAQLRLGVSVSPEHYDAGWHITGTCGAVGAAVTAGLLLGLGAGQLRAALEWAVEDGLGNREGFGSMIKPYHPGKAAVSGLRAALDVAAGADGPGDSLTGPEGFVHRLARGKFDPDALLGEPGTRWELLDNTFKPYPCGIVTHPAIETAEALHDRVVAHGGPDAVREIRLVCHPLVPELTGNLDPVDGLQARFSTAHGIAAGLLAPPVDLTGYATGFVVSEPARRLRSLIAFEPREGYGRDAARIDVTMADGTVLDHEVTHARGSLARPLTDEELKAKAHGLVDRIRPGGAEALDAAARRQGPGYLRGLLAAAAPIAAAPVDGASTADDLYVGDAMSPGTSAANSPAEELALAQLLADAGDLSLGHPHVEPVVRLIEEAARIRLNVPAGDERDRAGAVAAGLVEAGHRPVVAAAAAPCAAEDLPRDDAARAVALALAVAGRLADRLGVDVDRVSAFAAALAVTAAHRLPPETALRVLGQAGTRTTAVSGTAASTAADARRARVAAADAVETLALARRGFTGPARSLTGRRGLLSLLAQRAEPALTGPDLLDDAALGGILRSP